MVSLVPVAGLVWARPGWFRVAASGLDPRVDPAVAADCGCGCGVVVGLNVGRPRHVCGGASTLLVLSGGVLLSHILTNAVPSALWVLASGFGMGPGVSPTL